MTTYRQERPAWCPHPDCEFVVVKGQHRMCGGKLPRPEPHDGDENTHRICLEGAERDGGVFDLQINQSDAWWFGRLLQKLFEGETTVVMRASEARAMGEEEVERIIVAARPMGARATLAILWHMEHDPAWRDVSIEERVEAVREALRKEGSG